MIRVRFALANVYGADVLAVGNELAVGRHKSDPGVRHFTSEFRYFISPLHGKYGGGAGIINAS